MELRFRSTLYTTITPAKIKITGAAQRTNVIPLIAGLYSANWPYRSTKKLNTSWSVFPSDNKRRISRRRSSARNALESFMVWFWHFRHRTSSLIFSYRCCNIGSSNACPVSIAKSIEGTNISPINASRTFIQCSPVPRGSMVGNPGST